MTTQELLRIKKELNAKSTASSQALTSYCRPFQGAMGLISVECKQSPEYKRLKLAFDADWHTLRAFNHANRKNKDLQKAIRADIMERRTKKARENQS